jgi:hypothetical protein
MWDRHPGIDEHEATALRAARGDTESLALMAEPADIIDTSTRDVVSGLREHGYS